MTINIDVKQHFFVCAKSLNRIDVNGFLAT